MKQVHNLKPIRISLLLFALILSSLLVSAQCDLSCIGNTSLSLNSNCTATMTPANAVANASTDCSLTVQVFDENNVLLPTSPVITGAYIGQTVVLVVTDEASGSCCHTNVFVEDKMGPELTCVNDIVSCVEDIPMATATDNCGNPDITFAEFREQLDCSTGDFTFLVTRLYTATDNQGMTATCIQQVRIRKPAAADIIFPPDFNGIDQPALDCSAPNADPEITGRPTLNGQPIADACRLEAFFSDDTTTICEGTTKIFREWKVADWCSSSFIAQATQFIKILDNTGPVINCPADSIFGTDFADCSATITLPMPTATDDCSSVDNITFSVVWEFGNDFEPTPNVPIGTHIVTYTATDDCGNSSICQTKITVEDDDPPNVTCETSRTVGLNQDSTIFCAIELFDDGSNDNCTAVLDSFCIRRIDNPVFSDCVVFTCDDLGAAPVMVEFKVCDEVGNCSFCTTEITVMDNLPPVISFCPPDITLSCVDFISGDTTLTGSPVAMDACGIANISFEDEEDLDNCNAGTVTRTFTITGTDGLTASCQQVITFTPGDDPVITYPMPAQVECLTDTTDVTGFPTATDDCSNVFFIGFKDNVITLVENCEYTVSRTFIVGNDCNELLDTGVQIINVLDVTAPTFDEAADSITYSCASDIASFTPVATDNCNSEVEVTLQSSVDTPGSCPDNFTRTETYQAIDSCGNVSEEFVFTIIVNDDIAPTADPLPSLSFECIDDIPVADTAVVMNVADNCSDSILVEIVGTDIPSACLDTIFRTYRITDRCGNFTDLLQMFTILDTIPPTANQLADLGPFACVTDIPAPDISLVVNEQDNCRDTVIVSFLRDTIISICNGPVLRTYQIADQCGNTADIVQTIIVRDTVPPVLVHSVFSEFYDCVASIPDSILLFAPGMDNCGNIVESELLTNDNISRLVQCMDTIFQEFRLTDTCGNEAIVMRQILINDTLPPVFVNAPGSLDTIVECPINTRDVTPPTAMDACRPFPLVQIVSIDTTSFTCASGYTERIGFVATDACGNQTVDTFFVEVVVNDTTAPVFTILQRDTIARDQEPIFEEMICGEPFEFTTAAEDNYNIVSYRSEIIQSDKSIINLSGPTISRDFNTGVNTVIFFAEDACGNIAVDTFFVEVLDETVPNLSICRGGPFDVLLPEMSGQEIPLGFIAVGEDGCSTTLPPFLNSTGSPDPLVFDCNSLNGQSTIQIFDTVIISDVFGNEAGCPFSIILQNQGCPNILSATIAGQLEDQSGNGVDDVVVEIAGPVISQRVESAYGGTYTMPNLEMHEDYEIIPYRNDDLLNGISTMDLIMLGEHLLEISTLDSPYQLIAADINNDGAVTALDMIALRRALLIIDEEFQNNTSWRFVDGEYSFPDPTNPFASSFPESRFIHDLSTNEMVNDFMAIKVGDLNGNATSNGLQTGDTRSEEVLIITTEDQILEAGELYELAFSADNFVDLKGFQFTIDYNPLAITPEFDQELSKVLTKFNEQNIEFTQLENGLLSVSWHDVNPVTLTNRSEVFTLSFRAKVNTRLSKVLQFNDALLSAESYTADLQTQKLELEYEGNLVEPDTDTKFALLQNQPNPFRQQTVIPFVLPEAGDAKIEITDINGRLITEHEAYYEAGYQEFILDKSELNAGGVLFYRLQSGRFEATKKMVVIE